MLVIPSQRGSPSLAKTIGVAYEEFSKGACIGMEGGDAPAFDFRDIAILLHLHRSKAHVQSKSYEHLAQLDIVIDFGATKSAILPSTEALA